MLYVVSKARNTASAGTSSIRGPSRAAMEDEIKKAVGQTRIWCMQYVVCCLLFVVCCLFLVCLCVFVVCVLFVVSC